MERVSILVPCYNHEKYIDDCLNSLYMQSYSEIELLIIDDCSRDGSYKIIRSWEEKLKNRFLNVYIERNETNLGVTKTINKMLSKARGEYIKILASDDMLLSTAIEDFVSFARTNVSDMVFSNVALIKETDHFETLENNTQFQRILYRTIPPSGRGLTGIIGGNNYICAPGVIIPRKTFEKYGIFDEKYVLEDLEYWLRISVDGNLAYLNKVTALYRQNAESLSRFAVSKEAKKRHHVYCQDKIEIFEKYENQIDKAYASQFYNSELRSAIGVDDKELAAEILRKMDKKNLFVTFKNKLRLCGMKLGIYIRLKKLYHFLKLIIKR